MRGLCFSVIWPKMVIWANLLVLGNLRFFFFFPPNPSDGSRAAFVSPILLSMIWKSKSGDIFFVLKEASILRYPQRKGTRLITSHPQEPQECRTHGSYPPTPHIQLTRSEWHLPRKLWAVSAQLGMTEGPVIWDRVGILYDKERVVSEGLCELWKGSCRSEPSAGQDLLLQK